MIADLRKSGIELIGEAPWGMHFCQLYQGKEDLIEILVPYFKQGLENNEFCMWVTSEPLGVEDAKAALKEKVKNLDEYIKKGQIEILDYSQWYTKTGRFDADKVLEGWVEKERQAIEKGFDGLRLTGNTFWLEKKDWENFTNYEAIVNSAIGKHRMLAICSYSLDKCQAGEIIDVIYNHQFALIKKEGKWVSLESSERKRMEEALRESEDKYRLITENTSDYISIIKFDGTLIYISPSHKQLGYEPEDLLGKSGINMVHPEDKIKLLPLLKRYVQKKIAELLRIAEKRESERISFRFPDKSGNWHYLEATTNLIKNPVGGGYNILLISRDITERKQAEEALKESKERLELALSAASMGTWRWNIKTDQDTRDANFNSMLGLKAAESTQSVKDFIQYVHPDDRAVVDEEIKRAIRERDIYRIEFRIVRPDGTIYWLSDRGKIYYDQKNEPVYMTGAVFNITERKKAEEALKDYTRQIENVNKELDDFTYIVSHDLKEPLRSIDAFSKFVADDNKDKLDDQGRMYLERVRANTTRMQDLIEDLLEVSRIERKRNPLEEVEAEELINEVRLRLEFAIKQKNVEITVQDTLPKLFCDRVRLTEVFLNLISNAIKFNDKPNPKIDIGCREKDNFYEFYVKDNGPGIEERYFDKIFEIFQRLGKREEHEGTGAGLTIAKKVVQMHKGKIWVESKVGEGTTFYFTIPKKKEFILGKKKIGEILMEKKLVTEEDVKEALEEQGQMD